MLVKGLGENEGYTKKQIETYDSLTSLLHCLFKLLINLFVEWASGWIFSYEFSSHNCMCHHQIHIVTKNKLDIKLQR